MGGEGEGLGGRVEGQCGVKFISVLRTELSFEECPPRPSLPPYPLPPSSPPPRRGLLVTPKDHWPPFDGGLTMELVASGGGRGGEEEEGN